MKYLKLFESFEDIEQICKKYRIKNYTINQDGSIDVDGNVWLYEKKLTELPLKFNKVNNDFYCDYNELESLEGSPKEVNGHFYCRNNKLISLKYAPKIIRGGFYCRCNNIKTFEYFPSFIRDNFWCGDNPIYYVWKLFKDWTKIELLNDFDIFRDEDTDEPKIFIDRLNDFLEMIGKDPVESIDYYKNL